MMIPSARRCFIANQGCVVQLSVFSPLPFIELFRFYGLFAWMTYGGRWTSGRRAIRDEDSGDALSLSILGSLVSTSLTYRFGSN